MTDDRQIDRILKEELTKDFAIEATGPSMKKAVVYRKIGGLPNIGRTYFTSLDEIKAKNAWAQDQMANLYGSELYGRDAQLRTQGGRGGGQSLSGTTSGSSTEYNSSRDGLISCKFSPFLRIPDGKGYVKEARGWGAAEFVDQANQILIVLKDGVGKDETERANWKSALGGILSTMVDDLQYIIGHSAEGAGATEIQNRWLDFQNHMARKDKQAQLSLLKSQFNSLKKAWNQWETGGWGKDYDPAHSQDENSAWDPLLSFRIDVVTNFDENWFKRKFKSGVLNSMVRGAFNAIGQGIADRASPGPTKTDFRKRTADELTDGERRKLDSIQWKMTNKVARDYIRFLLGWSRDTAYQLDSNGLPVKCTELVQNDKFGSEMADRALSGRGMLGRMRQKLFSSQKSNNVVSVAFQLADPASWTDRTQSGASADESASVVVEWGLANEPFTDGELVYDQKTDPMWLESRRRSIVADVLSGRGGSADRLVDDCIMGYSAGR